MKPFWPRTRQLMPVHLQARDAYIEELLQRRLAPIEVAPCGVLDMKIDDAAWTKGSIAFKSLTALFPSGLLAALRQPISRSAAALPRTGASLYLGVDRTVLRGPNVVASAATEGGMRYRVQGDAAQPTLAPELRLIFEGEAMDDVEALNLGRVERNGARVQWEAGSFPTLVSVSAAPALKLALDRMIASLEQRKAELLRQRAERPFRVFEVAHQDLPALQLLAIVQRALPRLVDAARRRAVAPRELYEILVSLHGALTPFASEDRDPPAFVHDRLGASLPWLFAEIRGLLETAARDRTTILPFARVDASTYRLNFDREALVGKRPFLVARGGEETFLRDRVPSLLKMASPAAMPPLMESALRGVSVAVEFEPAPAIPRRPDVMAYRIDVRHPLWLDIEDRRAVMLYMPQAPTSLGFSLYGIERLP